MNNTYATASDFKRRQIKTMAEFHTRQLATILSGLNMPQCANCSATAHIVELHGDNLCSSCKENN